MKRRKFLFRTTSERPEAIKLTVTVHVPRPRRRGDRMRRRDLLAGLLAASLTTSALAQERRRVSILHSGFPNRTPIQDLFAALRELGYEDGRTATIELLGGEGNADRLNALVARLAQQPPDVIIALTSPAVLALKRAGVTDAGRIRLRTRPGRPWC